MSEDQHVIMVLNKLINRAKKSLELCDGADSDLPYLEGYIEGLERSKKAIQAKSKKTKRKVTV